MFSLLLWFVKHITRQESSAEKYCNIYTNYSNRTYKYNFMCAKHVQNNMWDNVSVKMYFTLFIRICSTRWAENKDFVEEAIQFWPAVVKVIGHFQSMTPSKRPKITSHDTLVKHYSDKFVMLSLQFFFNIAAIFKSFLKV